MTDAATERQAAIENVTAWRQARDANKPGSVEYQSLDAELRKAEVALNNLGKQK